MILSVIGLQACDKDSEDSLPYQLPASIQSFINVEYPNARIGSYYLLELEKGNKEVKIKMDRIGNIIL